MSDQASESMQATSRRRMQVVAERVVADEPQAPTTTATTITSPTSPQQTTTNELIARAAWRQGVFGALAVAIRILSARAILLLAVIGAVVLTYIALSQGDVLRLAVVAVYLVGAVLPLVWLASRG